MAYVKNGFLMCKFEREEDGEQAINISHIKYFYATKEYCAYFVMDNNFAMSCETYEEIKRALDLLPDVTKERNDTTISCPRCHRLMKRDGSICKCFDCHIITLDGQIGPLATNCMECGCELNDKHSNTCKPCFQKKYPNIHPSLAAAFTEKWTEEEIEEFKERQKMCRPYVFNKIPDTHAYPLEETIHCAPDGTGRFWPIA